MHYRLILTGLLALLLLALVSCGTSNGVTAGPGFAEDVREGTGVSVGDFEVIRYNSEGFADPALNNTLKLELTSVSGQPGLIINVTDSQFTSLVAVDVFYDSGKIHPASVDFHDAMGSESQVLSASFLTETPGIAAIGQAAIRDYRPAQIDGAFATVVFAPGGLRSVSLAGDVHQNASGVAEIVRESAAAGPTALPNLVLIDTDPDDSLAQVQWYTAWHIADGDQNSEVNLADLAPLGAFLSERPSVNWDAAVADYDQNDEVNQADLAPMGKFLREGTTEYLVQAGDNTDGATLSDISTLLWGDKVTAPGGGGTSLADVFDSWTVEFSGASFTDLTALDVDADGFARVTITPRRAGAVTGNVDGASSSIDVPVGDDIINPPDPARITISEIVVNVDGATDGIDGGSTFGSAETTGTAQANSTIDMSLESISGSFVSEEGSGNFDAATIPTGMEQQDYDDALAAVRAALAWSIDHGGAAGFRRTIDWLIFTQVPPAMGDPGGAQVFSDDDPESTGASSEGVIGLSLPQTTDFDPAPERIIEVVSPIQFDLFIDVVADPAAPVTGDVTDPNTGDPLVEMLRGVPNDFSIPLTYGSGGPTPDPLTVMLQLIEFDANGLPVGDPYELTNVDNAPQVGEFEVREDGAGGQLLNGVVSGLILAPGSTYHFRTQVDNLWSSVNKPEDLLTTAEPPPAADLETVPNIVGQGRNYIHIFHPDPVIHRNPVVTMDLIGKQANPDDNTAFMDVLKTSGESIIPSVSEGSLTFPHIIIMEGDDANLITPDMQEDEAAGIFTEGSRGGRLIASMNGVGSKRSWGKYTVDIRTLPDVPQFGEVEYVYKLFNSDGSAVGQGSFVKQDSPFAPGAPIAINWAVNLFDRDATPMASRDYTGKNIVNGNTVTQDPETTIRPDVLWFEFRDGYVYDPDPNNNVKVLCEHQAGTLNNSRYTMDLRVVGVDNENQYIAIHPIQYFDFFDPDVPLGNLLAGELYNLHLDDPTRPNQFESSFTKVLQVGSNPAD